MTEALGVVLAKGQTTTDSGLVGSAVEWVYVCVHRPNLDISHSA